MWQELGFEWARELNQIKSATRIGDIVQGLDLLTVSSDSNTKAIIYYTLVQPNLF